MFCIYPCVTMEKVKVIVRFIVFGAGLYRASACGNTVGFTLRPGFIESPNFWEEYGKAANCTWQFNDINMSYALRLTLTDMKMFYDDIHGAKRCGDSYRLTVNEERVNCTLEIGSGRYVIHYSFYSNPSCGGVEWIKINSTSIKIEYFANGRKPVKGGSSMMYGFKMKYEYQDCPTAGIPSTQRSNPATSITTTVASIATATSTRSASPTTIASTTTITSTSTVGSETAPKTSRTVPSATKPKTFEETPTSPIAKAITAWSSENISHVESSSRMPVDEEEGSKEGNALIPTVGGGIGGLAFLVIIILVIVRCQKKGQKAGNLGSSTVDDESRPNMTDNILYGTAEDFVNDAGHGSVDAAVTYAVVNTIVEAPTTEKTNSPEVSISETMNDENSDPSDDNGHASVNPVALYAVVDKSVDRAKANAPTYAQVHESAKAASLEMNPTSNATNELPVYAAVAVHDGGAKSTVHIQNDES